MKFSIATILASAAAVLAQTDGFLAVNAPNGTAGGVFHIKWAEPAPQYAGQAVILSLIGGRAQNAQVPIQEIATVNSSDMSYNWTAPASWGSEAYYGLTVKLASNPSVMQYSNPFFNVGTKTPTISTTTAGSPSATKTISLSSHSAVYTAPSGGYTTVVDVSVTTTVPCINGTVSTTAPYAPPVSTGPSSPYSPPVVSVPGISIPVVSVPYKNATFSTAYVPPASTGPSSPYSPPVATPVATPVTGAGARFAAPVAAVAGIFVAAFAL